MLSFIQKYKWFLLLYLAAVYYILAVQKFYTAFAVYAILLVFVIYLDYRKKVDLEMGFALLYRTQFGLKFIGKIAEKHREWVKLFGYSGIGVGFIGMALISILLVVNIFQIFLQPAAPAGAGLVFPGLNVPGLGILPFWDWIIAIFIIAIVHEFSHGIVAHAHNLRVNKTGIVLFGPILGAFVEPDEKKLQSVDDAVQYSVYAAGSFSNIMLALIALLILSLAVSPLQNFVTEPKGITFDVSEGMPAQKSGLKSGDIIDSVNGVEVHVYSDFSDEFRYVKANETVLLGVNGKVVEVETGKNPSGGALLGISSIKDHEVPMVGYETLNSVLLVLERFFRWLYLLSLGIGIFNLLPLPIVDGGRMAQTFLKRLYGEEKGNRRFAKIGVTFLIIVLILLLLPFVLKRIGL